jgi:hypothetical protein
MVKVVLLGKLNFSKLRHPQGCSRNLKGLPASSHLCSLLRALRVAHNGHSAFPLLCRNLEAHEGPSNDLINPRNLLINPAN